MTEKTDNIPDKAAYQVNRRLMCWAALAMMMVVVICYLISPEKYNGSELTPIFYGLSGLVAVYFGSTAVQQVKK